MTPIKRGTAKRLGTWSLWTFTLLLLAAIALFAFTDVWPYMHEVIWQHSWKPVCPAPGGMEYCR